MLSVLQPRHRTLVRRGGLRQKFKRWWLGMTDQEQRDMFIRGSMIAVCVVAVSVTGPVIAEVQSGVRAEADYRALAQRLAAYEDGGLAVRSDAHAAPVVNSPWLRSVEYTLKRDLDSSLSRYAMRDRDGAALASLVSFNPEHIRRAETIERETMCMAQAVYYEAGNEPLAGQLAVAEVVANRMRDHRYPDTACGVVFQGSTRTTGCQFTFTCDGAMKVKPRGENWARAQRIASHVMMGLHEERTGGATHYHATYVDPVWNSGLVRTADIGLHIFYRFPRGAEWAVARRNYEARLARDLALAEAGAGEADLAALDEGLLFSEASSAAANDGFYTIAPGAAPAAITTSTRTVSNGAPRLIAIEPASMNSAISQPAAAELSVEAYMARQTGAAVIPVAAQAGALP